MSSADGRPGEPDLTVLHLIHAALRRDLHRLNTAAARMADLPVARREAIGGRWAAFAEQLREHHGVEDRFVWPLLRERAGGACDPLLAEMRSEHDQLDPLLAQTATLMAKMVTAPAPAAQERLAESLGRLRDVLEAHLHHEESDAIPLVRRYITKADLDAIDAAQRREAGLDGARRFLPWLLDQAPAPEAARLRGRLPLPLKVLLPRWDKRYADALAAAFT